jgi:hypothetical protein
MAKRNWGFALFIGLTILAGMSCTDMGDEITQSANHAPVITSAASVNTIVGQRLLYRVQASDPDGSIPAASIFNEPSWLASSADSIYGVTPIGAADTSFMVVASDGTLSDTLTVNITVGTVNRAPQLTSPDTATATETEHFYYHGTAIDPDGTTPTITYTNYAIWMAPEGDSLHCDAPVGAADTSFWVIASDGLLADSLEVAITVADAPAAISYGSQIQPIFTGNCLTSGCHAMGPTPAAGLRLMNYSSLMQGSISGVVVVPFEPDSSILVQQLEGIRQPQMPFGLPPLPDSAIQLIYMWIEQGAQDN